MADQKEFTKGIALEYFAAYARYEKVYLDESIKINSDEKIRGDVGAAEFEYRENEKLFIVRGLINKDISGANIKFKELLIDTLFKINENPKFSFNDAMFEFDTTAYELQEDYPERINLRMDFNKPISKTEFVKRVDALMDESYKFSINEYRSITSSINKIVFAK